MAFTDWIIGLSSTTLRVVAYLFLRWIPGHQFLPIILAAFAIYLTTALPKFFQTAPYKVISDEIDIITKETVGRYDRDAVDDGLVDGPIEEPLQEIDVQETIIVEENDPHVLRTLLTGLPSPRSLFWSIITALINLALVAMVLDMTYTAPFFHPSHNLSMTRVGYVSDKTAEILVREPHAVQYPLFLSYRHADVPLAVSGRAAPDTSWKSAGSIRWLDNSTDFTGSFKITGLQPDTRYQYAASTNHSGYFTTPPKPGHVSPRKGDAFTFIHSSCIKPRFPYNPVKHALSMPGFAHLARVLPTLGAQFMLFLGDFIYVDVPRRQGTDAETYRREYRQVYASPDWASVSSLPGAELPWIHVYDDHEIANDWASNTTGVYAAAADPFQHYHVAVNPPPVRPGATYFSFVQGPASFFMLDTRRYRDAFDGTDGTWDGPARKSMLGAQQRSDLLAWLARAEPTGVRWKIVVSSVPFTKNWRFGSEDTWAGYLGERRAVLEAMWDVGLGSGGVGVVVLSGDRHEFAATAFPPPAEGVPLSPSSAGLDLAVRGRRGAAAAGGNKVWPLSATVHEFSVSPLSMFYLPLRTYSQQDDEDICIKYIPDGNSKFGAVTLSTAATSEQSALHYRLYVDGEETWSYTLMTPPKVRGSGRAKDAIWG